LPILGISTDFHYPKSFLAACEYTKGRTKSIKIAFLEYVPVFCRNLLPLMNFTLKMEAVMPFQM
jgi:hypothetical protein